MTKKLVAMATFGILSCAGQGDIDRTQPNKLPKSLFEGTWYVRSTVVDLPATSVEAFGGIQGELEKVVWEIQQDYLIAWRAYEELPGSDRERADQDTTRPFQTENTATKARDVGRLDGDKFGDNPIAAFSILDHFDVKRQYNAATGEQTNVIYEDSSDRPWYEREYIRVDWASEQLYNPFTIFDEWGSVTDLSYYVEQNENSEDAFRVLGKDTGEDGISVDVPLDFDNVLADNRPDASSAYYMDMVGRLFLEPKTITYLNGARYPYCWFAFGVTCGPTYLKVRTSFLKVGEQNEGFEPQIMDDQDMGRFGYFRTERLSYDRQRGLTESGRINMANRHGIWEDNYQFQLDENGQKNFTLDDDGNRIPIPQDERTPKPIVYHLSPGYPEDLVDVTKNIGREWNHVFRTAVAVAKGCLTATTQDVNDVPKTCSDKNNCCVPDMFLVHGNGWLEGESPYLNYDAQGKYTYDVSRQEARLGDLRYNVLSWFDNAAIATPLGYGPSSADPETGQIISGNANVYGAKVDVYATFALDIIQVLNGDRSVDDLVDADYVRDQIAKNLTPVDPRSLPDDVRNVPSGEVGRFMLGEERFAKLEEAQDLVRTGKLGNANPLWEIQRMDMIRGTPAEQWALNDELMRELLPNYTSEPINTAALAVDEDLRQAMDPLTNLGPEMMAFEKYREDWASRNNIWLAEFSDGAVMGLAMQYKGRTDYDQMWKEIRDSIYEAVMLHELGHTVGLRHNFAGSNDSVNYFDRYWELREENLVHKQASAFSFADELAQTTRTETQIVERMPEYEYSTVMDYAARFNSDIHGLGKYDQAAVLFGYTGYVEVFDPETYVTSEAERLAVDQDAETAAVNVETIDLALKNTLWLRLADCTPMFEGRTSPAMRSPVEVFHYTQVPDLLFGSENPADPSATNESWRGYRYRTYAKWSELRPEIEDATQRCRDVVEAEGENCDPDEIYYGGSKCSSAVSKNWGLVNEGQRPLLVPYQFCGDEYAGVVQSCYRFDQGADPYEQVSDRLQAYRNYYWFTHFKRDRLGFSPYSTMFTMYQRYFTFFTGAYQQYLVSPKWDDLLNDYWMIAMLVGFSELQSVISTPQMGLYGLNEDTNTWELGIDDSSSVYLDRGPAKRTWTDYSWDKGYFAPYKPREVGHFWDYLAAMRALTQATASVVNVDRNNLGAYYLPYYLVFQTDLHRFFEGIYAEDYDQYAPRMIDGESKHVINGIPLQGGGVLDPVTWQVLEDPTEGSPIETMSSFSFRYYAMVYGMAGFPVWDSDFLYRNRVMVVGSGEDLNVGAGYTLETCTDPQTGTQYGASCDDDWAEDESGGGCKTIRKCQELATECEVLRECQAVSPTPSTCDNANACSTLDAHILSLDVQRALYSVFQYGIW